MKAKFKVLSNNGVLRDCTVGKVHEGLIDECGRFFEFIDDVGDRVNVEIDNRLEKVEENMNKEFTKDMLVAGKHVVRYSGDDSLNLVLQVGDSLYLVCLNSDMYSSPLEDSDIKEVYLMKKYSTLDDLRCGHNLKLIWERNEKSQQEIEYEALMQKIAELEAQARKLKP